MKAKIKDNAYELFCKETNKTFSGSRVAPKSYWDFADIIKEYTGIIMVVNRQYDDRTCLTYPIPRPGNVTGMDIENYLLDFIYED